MVTLLKIVDDNCLVEVAVMCTSNSSSNNANFFQKVIKRGEIRFLQDLIRAVAIIMILAPLFSGCCSPWFCLLTLPYALISIGAGLLGCYYWLTYMTRTTTKSDNPISCRSICCHIGLWILWAVFLPLVAATCIILAPLSFVFLPSFCFFNLMIERVLGNSGVIKTHAYYDAVLEFILNHDNSTEIKKHIIASNYELLQTLTPQIQYHYKEFSDRSYVDGKSANTVITINYIANKHNDISGGGTNQITWKDLRQNNWIHPGSNGYFPIMIYALFGFMFVYQLLIVIVAISVQYDSRNLGIIVYCLIYVIIDIVYMFMTVKMMILLFYHYHSFIFVPVCSKHMHVEWDDAYGDVERMVWELNATYDTMFGTDIGIVMEELTEFNADIRRIIIEYLWSPIPIYQDESIDLGDSERPISIK